MTLFPTSNVHSATTATAEVRAERELGAKPCAIESQQRPFILMNGERLAELRQTMRTPGWKQNLYSGTVRRNAERWLGRRITIPAPAGHYHNYTCADGNKLKVPEDQEFKTTGTYACTACGKQYSGEKFDGGRRNLEHRWLMTACRDMAFVAAVEQDGRFAKKAAEILLKYADAYPGRHINITKGGIYYQSLDESVTFIWLAQAYDLIYDSGVLTSAQKQHIESDLFWEAAEGITECGLGGNWGSWHLAAVGVIGYATKHQRYIDYGLESFKSQMAEQLGEDGIWPESVHTYHFYPMRAFLHFAEASANSGTNLYSWEAGPKRNLRAMFMEPLQYMYPNYQLPAINDGWYAVYLPVELYELAYDRLKEPELAWTVKQMREREIEKLNTSPDAEVMWTIVHGRELPDAPTAPVFRSYNFPVLGIATLRRGSPTPPDQELMVTFDYGAFLGHGQFDQMGITLFAHNRVLVPDYGTPSYGSAIMPYYKGTIGHNTVMVDEKNQAAPKIAPTLRFEDTPELKTACAETTDAYSGVTWRRCVEHHGDSVVVRDSVKSDAAHKYDWLIHGEGEKFNLNGCEPADGDATTTFSSPFMTETTAYKPRGKSIEATWLGSDGKGLKLEAAVTGETVIFVGKCPAETATRRVYAIAIRRFNEVAEFEVRLKPF